MPAFGDVPFGPDALASPLAYLNSLQGVMLQVTGPQTMSGRLLQAETVRENVNPDQPRIRHHADPCDIADRYRVAAIRAWKIPNRYKSRTRRCATRSPRSR